MRLEENLVLVALAGFDEADEDELANELRVNGAQVLPLSELSRCTHLLCEDGDATDVAIEASDLTIVSGDLRAVADAIALSRRTLAVIKGNLFWAFAYNLYTLAIISVNPSSSRSRFSKT